MAKRRDVVVTYILWLLGGVYGLHRFYLGNTRYALLQMFTLGGLGILAVADLLLIPAAVRAANAQIAAGKKFPSFVGYACYFLSGCAIAGYGLEMVAKKYAPQLGLVAEFEELEKDFGKEQEAQKTETY